MHALFPVLIQVSPVAALPPPSDQAAAIVRFNAEPAICDGEQQRATVSEEPFPLAFLQPRSAPLRAPVAITLRFRIDASGRPLGIAVAGDAAVPYDLRDLPAALAAWRFAPGAERRDCRIRFIAEAEPVRTARPETLYRFLALNPLSGQRRLSEVGEPAFQRARPAISTCEPPLPNARLLAFPPFERIPQPPGTFSYSWVGFDIAPDGRVRRARLLGGSGNDLLDRESLSAISRSRYQPGARTGCIYHFFRRNTAPTLPPPAPDDDSFRPESATCPDEEPEWAAMAPLQFPPAFNRRGIEGWAIVSYDLAPWGETGNVRVLAAEPAAAFGEQAAMIVRMARAVAGTGHVGCTVRVVFRLPDGTPRAEDDD